MPFNACARYRRRYLSAVHIKWGLPSGTVQALSNVSKEGPLALHMGGDAFQGGLTAAGNCCPP